MKADVLFSYYEPPSWGAFAWRQCQEDGLVINAVPMGQDPAFVMDALRASEAEAIILVSPIFYSDFFAAQDIESLGKPIIELVAEWTWGNSLHSHREWQENRRFRADAYFCAQRSDVDQMHRLGRRAYPLKPFLSTRHFRKGGPLAQRVPKLCFVGATGEDTPWVYGERRRQLAALREAGLVDVLGIPKGPQSAHMVAYAYATYAGVFCPPANGLAHSIRTYEAASAGALVVESQPMLPENVCLRDGIQRIAVPEGIEADELREIVRSIKFPDMQHIADAGHAYVAEHCDASRVVREILATL